MTVFSQSDFDHIFGYLDTNGDKTGTNNAIGDYSATPEEFFIQPPQGAVWAIERIIISIHGQCGSSGYGSEDPLVNGITMKTTDSSGEMLLNLTNGVPIKDEMAWGALCYDVHLSETRDLPAEPFAPRWVFARWTFGKSGLPIVLRDQERLVVTLSDDMEHLTEHRFQAQGAIANYLYTPPE